MIDHPTRGALEWGGFSASGDRLTLRYAVQAYYWTSGAGPRVSSSEPYPPGIYRWRVRDGLLRLTTIRDRLPERPEALTSAPLKRIHTGPAKLQSG